MHKPQYFTSNGIALAIENLIGSKKTSVIDILDAIEESKTAVELQNKLNSLDLLEKFCLDRTTDTYVRLKSRDMFGNIHYFKAEFDSKPHHHLDEYYDGMADNYQIPISEMTAELMKEATDFIKSYPFEEGGYLLMYCPQEIGYEESFWCITSWVE